MDKKQQDFFAAHPLLMAVAETAPYPLRIAVSAGDIWIDDSTGEIVVDITTGVTDAVLVRRAAMTYLTRDLGLTVTQV